MSIVLADYLQRKACAWHGPAHLSGQLLAELLQPPCGAEALTSSMLERWHHSSVNYSTQVQLAPQSSKLGSCARSTSRGTVLRNQAISVYGRTGLTDMASCCRCTASTRGLAIRLIGSSGQRLFQHRHTDQTQKRK